jgi:lipoprotein-anchoring transpeptidase ErfK/SrfK
MPLHRPVFALMSVSLLALSGCGFNGAEDEGVQPATEVSDAALADTMRSRDGDAADAIPDSQTRAEMQLQVVLDRLGFAPGVVDGKMGFSTVNALKAFQEARSIPVTGEYDQATQDRLKNWASIPATRVVTIPDEWSSVTFQPVPEGAAAQSEVDLLGYESLDEKLAERFHTTVDVLRELNPGGRPAGSAGAAEASPTSTAAASASRQLDREVSTFRPGQQIRVPNIGADAIAPGAIQDRGWQETLTSLGVGASQPSVERVVVDESDKMLRAYDAGGELVAAFTVSSGSSRDPLPIGEWGINGVAHNPPFTYQPDLFWDVSDDHAERQLPPGPNGPVGVVWIDLTKEHYGIHGTPNPETIGRAQSHGCVRLTNWDAARLAEMVSGSTQVTFQR